MIALKLGNMIDGTKYIERKIRKELLIISILSKIFIKNANSVLVLCSVTVGTQ